MEKFMTKNAEGPKCGLQYEGETQVQAKKLKSTKS
jgi:hypothetical protein